MDSQSQPLRQSRARPNFNPEVAPPPPAPTATEDPRAPVKVKPYHGSCPKCGHGTMFPLVRFYETDVNENPTAGAVMPSKRTSAWVARLW